MKSTWAWRAMWAAIVAVAVAVPAMMLRAEDDGPKAPRVKPAGGGEGDRGREGEGGVRPPRVREGGGEGEKRGEGAKWRPAWRGAFDRAMRVKLTPEQQAKIDAIMAAAVKDITDNVLTVEQREEMSKAGERKEGDRGREGGAVGPPRAGAGERKREGGEGDRGGEGVRRGGEGERKREGGEGDRGQGDAKDAPKKPAGGKDTPSWW